jgi:hypothetical protein
LIEVCHVHKADVHPLAREDCRQQDRGGAIQILSRDHSDTRDHFERQQRGMNGGHS